VIIQKGAIFSAFNIGLATLLAVVQIFATFYEIAGGMVREHEDGTYPRLLLSPVGLGSIMFGKTLYDLVLGTARTLIVLGLAIYVYGARPNTDIGTLLVISLLIALLTMGFGFLVSSLRVSARAVVIVEFFLVLFLLGFSGLAIEKELLRGIARTIAYVQPWAYGFDALTRTILTGQPLLSLTSELRIITFAIIVFYALSYALLALWRERLLL
jgi:ABC-2 type transport system permease protein